MGIAAILKSTIFGIVLQYHVSSKMLSSAMNMERADGRTHTYRLYIHFELFLRMSEGFGDFVERNATSIIWSVPCRSNWNVFGMKWRFRE